MTKEQEAIETMRHWIDYEKQNKDKINKADELIDIQETVLNMLKENSAEIHQKNTELAEKNAEIEKYKKLLADNLARELNNSIKAKEKADTDLDDLDKGWKVELEKKDKMIDLMAEYMSDLDIDEEICKHQVQAFCDNKPEGVTLDVCAKCIKQYFERKAE